MHVSTIASLAPWFVVAAAGSLIGLGLYTFHEAKGTGYLSNDPAVCVNCHVMNEQYDGWLHGPHGRVTTCNDCHVPQGVAGKYATKVEHGWRHGTAFTLGGFREPIRITPSSMQVVLDNCVRCHASMVDSISPHGGSYPHSGDSGLLDCVHCHARVAHGSTR